MVNVEKQWVCKKDGKDVYSYHFVNKNGAEMTLTNYGATITSVRMPDRHGEFDEVILGYDSVEKYIEANPFYFGCIMGRFANRIKSGSFSIDGKKYQLNCNEGKNHLHGGNIGFYQRVFDGQIDDDCVVLSYYSPDGEEKYPGNLIVKVRYELTDENEVVISYEAKTDKETIINLTNHSYFNLNGGKKPPFDHIVYINSDHYVATGKDLIPTGELKPVAGTPFDFQKPHKIVDSMFDFSNDDIVIGKGFDVTMALKGEGFRKVAEMLDESTGRKMVVSTDQPGMQLFTAHIIIEGTPGLHGRKYGPYFGICMEPQVYPDSPNKKNFPNCVLRKGEVYSNKVVYKFSTI